MSDNVILRPMVVGVILLVVSFLASFFLLVIWSSLGLHWICRCRCEVARQFCDKMHPLGIWKETPMQCKCAKGH